MFWECENPTWTCGNKVNWVKSGTNNNRLTQARDEATTMTLGGASLVIHSATRNFVIESNGSWTSDVTYAMLNNDGDPIPCPDATQHGSDSHSVSEGYQCTNIVFNFLDTRYGNAIFTETIESVTFSYSGSEMAGFLGAWGLLWYPKYVITNCVKNKTVNYCVMAKGVKTILKTETTSTLVHGTGNPLILVWGNPPSQSQPWANCDDIKLYGFYDYHSMGDDSGRIEKDGGDDFYFTDWMRLIGAANSDQNQSDAENRYYDYYLRGGAPPPSSYTITGVSSSDSPIGSIAVDPGGNVAYSAELGGDYYNFITNGDIQTLTKVEGANFRAYPVGII